MDRMSLSQFWSLSFSGPKIPFSDSGVAPFALFLNRAWETFRLFKEFGSFPSLPGPSIRLLAGLNPQKFGPSLHFNWTETAIRRLRWQDVKPFQSAEEPEMSTLHRDLRTRLMARESGLTV